MSNVSLVFHEFWNNREWQHGDVFVALLETVIMAFLCTALAAMFGLGPLSGIMAIFFTDTGTLGKLFSEAIENIDSKPVDGITQPAQRPSSVTALV